jgi:DNA-directed RNA polymerase specialized sigma subunit
MRMNAENYLNQVKMLDQLIDAKLAERVRLNEIATNISPKMPDGMPHSNTGMVSKTMENAIINLVMLEQEIDKLIDKYVDYKQEVVSNLEKLSAIEYGILHRYYIRYMTLEQIAEDMGYCRQQIWRLKKKGLQNLEDVIECNTKKCYNV